MSLKDTLKKAKQIECQLAQQDELTSCQALGAVKPRNYLALDPLLKKGGIHTSETAQAQHKKFRKDAKFFLNKTQWRE